MGINEILFYSGEIKYISAMVNPRNPNDLVIISEAKYELIDSKGQLVETGDCEIENREIRLLLGINKAGQYTLKLTVKIGKETVIQKADVMVEG